MSGDAISQSAITGTPSSKVQFVATLISSTALIIGIIIQIVVHIRTLKQQQRLQEQTFQNQQKLQDITIAEQKRFKAVDAFIHCQKRFHDLTCHDRVELKKQADALKKEESLGGTGTLYWQCTEDIGKDYWLRFWVIQQEQFYFYNIGFIPAEVFRSWMKHRYNEYQLRRQKSFLGVTWEQGWAHAKEMIEDEKFTSYMERVFKSDINPPETISQRSPSTSGGLAMPA